MFLADFTLAFLIYLLFARRKAGNDSTIIEYINIALLEGDILTEAWLIEIAKGIGMIFLNPLLYWSIFFVFIVGYRRVKKERMDFGIKVFDVFAEWKGTWMFSLLFGIVLSLITIGVGIVFSYETILLLCMVVILFSLTFKFTLLSASYTIGITYLMLLLLPFLLENQSYVKADLFSQTNFIGLAILLGIFLIAEAVLLFRVKRNESFPGLVLGNRGAWVGQHRIRKLSMIPFFTLVPAEVITPFAPFWPYFSIGESSYSLILVPFVIGFDFMIRGSLPKSAAATLAKATAFLGVIVLLMAVGGIYLFWLSFLSVVIAILGREYIRYRHNVNDRKGIPYFHQINNGLKVLGIIPGSPADRLKILSGETISKVNGKKVNSEAAFYLFLQDSGSFFKLEILDDAGEIRLLQSAFYEGEHHELGLLFTTEPYRNK